MRRDTCNAMKLSVTGQQKEEKLRITRISANPFARICVIRSFLLPNRLSGEGVSGLVWTSRRRGMRLTYHDKWLPQIVFIANPVLPEAPLPNPPFPVPRATP